MKIGLFGGSFNPVHNGHVVIGRTMLRVMGLDEVWYMVSPHNPLKRLDNLLSETERLRIVQKALEGEEGLKASDYEFYLPRPSYTWETLKKLHEDFPDNEFVLIIGGDNWTKFHKWAHNEEILATHQIAVFPREGESVPEVPPAGVTFVDIPHVNITSTMLRGMLQRGEDISPFVPRAVLPDIINMYSQGKAGK